MPPAASEADLGGRPAHRCSPHVQLGHPGSWRRSLRSSTMAMRSPRRKAGGGHPAAAWSFRCPAAQHPLCTGPGNVSGHHRVRHRPLAAMLRTGWRCPQGADGAPRGLPGRKAMRWPPQGHVAVPLLIGPVEGMLAEDSAMAFTWSWAVTSAHLVPRAGYDPHGRWRSGFRASPPEGPPGFWIRFGKAQGEKVEGFLPGHWASPLSP